MRGLEEFVNKRIRFKMIYNDINFSAKFIGIGVAESGNFGLVFDNVIESTYGNIKSRMLIHPNRIKPADSVSFKFIRDARMLLKGKKTFKNDDIYYSKNQIKMAIPAKVV